MAGFFMAAVGSGTPPVPSGEQEFLGGSGFFTVPDGVFVIEWSAWGAGGSGGTGTTDAEGGGGGGGGGAFARNVRAVTPGDQIQYTIGVGGVKSTGYNVDGSDGTMTTCDGFIMGGGGKGHTAGWLGSPQRAGGVGGVAPTGVTYSEAGNPGENGTRGDAGGPFGGAGGASPRGGEPGYGPHVAESPYWGGGGPGGAPGSGGGGSIEPTNGGGEGGGGKVVFKWGPDTTL